MLQLDNIDRQLLAALQSAGRTTNRDLAKLVGLSPAPCWHRIKRLESCGIIDHYAAILDTSLAGQKFRAFVGVTLSAHTKEARQDFETKVLAMPNVLQCYWMAGDVDYKLTVAAANMAEFEIFLEQTLLTTQGVAKANSQIALKEVKRTTVLSLDAIATKTSTRNDA